MQASRSTEASAKNLLRRKEEVIIWLTVFVDRDEESELSITRY
jgi:hypothetical protein